MDNYEDYEEFFDIDEDFELSVSLLDESDLWNER